MDLDCLGVSLESSTHKLSQVQVFFICKISIITVASSLIIAIHWCNNRSYNNKMN